VPVEVDFENACFATPLGAAVDSRAKALHRSCRCRQRRRTSVVFLIGGAGRGASSTPMVGLGSPGEILAPSSRAGDDGSYVVIFLEASSWRPCCAVGACFSRRSVGGCRDNSQVSSGLIGGHARNVRPEPKLSSSLGALSSLELKPLA
jgi:hypothetical protein